MKSRRRAVFGVTFALLMAASLMLSVGAAQGAPPSFTPGVVIGGASTTNPNANPSVLNGAPWALTGYVMSKYNGSVHIWLYSCSENVLQLGFRPGDIIEIFLGEEQINSMNTGDWVLLTGFTVNGNLAGGWGSGSVNVLPAPFSY